MIFRQVFDHETYSFSYLLACEASKEAIIIDPVLGQVDMLIQYLEELGLTLVKTIETHVHADHITGAGQLRERLNSESYSGIEAGVECASHNFKDGDQITLGSLTLEAIHTPGHTEDSYSFLLKDGEGQYLFTGDTLLIRGTGRTDFQNGDPHKLFASLNRLLKLEDSTWVYPGHDYNGRNVSSIGEENLHNPRIAKRDEKEFVKMMQELKLAKPKFIDQAVPANQSCGNNQQKMEAGA